MGTYDVDSGDLRKGSVWINVLDVIEPANPTRLSVKTDGRCFEARVDRPSGALALVVLANGTSPETFAVFDDLATVLRAKGFATVTADLLTPGEESLSSKKGLAYRASMPLLRRRLSNLLSAIRDRSDLASLPFGIISSGVAASAALSIAVNDPRPPRALVLYNGRPEMAKQDLPWLLVPSLCIVEGNDEIVLEANQGACEHVTRTPTRFFCAAATREGERAAAKEILAWLLTYVCD